LVIRSELADEYEGPQSLKGKKIELKKTFSEKDAARLENAFREF